MEYEEKNLSEGLRTLERLDEPLLECVRTIQAHRSRFDPFNLCDPDTPSESLPTYYRLGLEPTAVAVTITGAGGLRAGGSAVVGVGFVHDKACRAAAPSTTLANRAEFVDQLLSPDPIAWRTALEQEADNLAGHVLDDTSFRLLLDGITRRPEHVMLVWLEPLTPYLTNAQLLDLYRAGDLLVRLNNAIPEAPA